MSASEYETRLHRNSTLTHACDGLSTHFCAYTFFHSEDWGTDTVFHSPFSLMEASSSIRLIDLNYFHFLPDFLGVVPLRYHISAWGYAADIDHDALVPLIMILRRYLNSFLLVNTL